MGQSVSTGECSEFSGESRLIWCSTRLQVPFLNLMGLLAERAGSVHVRVGGNTQESAALVASLPNSKILEKQAVNVNDPVRRQIDDRDLFVMVLISGTLDQMTIDANPILALHSGPYLPPFKHIFARECEMVPRLPFQRHIQPAPRYRRVRGANSGR